MARPLRIEFLGAVYHITSRGNNRKEIFGGNLDRKAFLEILYGVKVRYNWLCHAYCLMDNHYHLLVETLDGKLSKGMRQLNGIYTLLFNKVHGRVGHFFQGRFQEIVVQKDSHLLDASRYIILNPARRVLIPKEGSNKICPLGIPVVMDRIVSQSINLVFKGLFDPAFTKSNFGIRRGHSQHQAIRHVQGIVEDGYKWAASIDLKSFFDEIPHELILTLIRRKIADERPVTLIARA
jgi:REP element-mobilizing transposase RayT